MGVIAKVGRVSVVEKKGNLYLRATLPIPVEYGREIGQVRWLSTGYKADQVEWAKVIASELDSDLAKHRLGIRFPGKWLEGRGTGQTTENTHYTKARLGKAASSNTSQGKAGSIESGNDGSKSSGKNKSIVDELIEAMELYINSQDFAPSTYFNRTVRVKALKRVFEMDRVRRCVNQIELKSVIKEIVEEKWKVPGDYLQFLNQVFPYCNSPITPYVIEDGGKRKKKKTRLEGKEYFTKEERDRIINSFLSRRNAFSDTYCLKYSHQLNTVMGYYCQFCFLTGCRLGEGCALKWENVDLIANRILFVEKDSRTVEGQKIVKGLKTQESREFPINSQLRSLLITLKELNYSDVYVFPNKYGNHLSEPSVRYRWKKELELLGIRRRKPYCMRHSFITYCLQENVPVATVASWVGNSPERIYQHYAGVIKQDVPEL